MPEGPEVKRLVDQLNIEIIDRSLKLTDIILLSGRYTKTLPIGYEKFKMGLSSPQLVPSINCHGKFIWWELADRLLGTQYIFSTLGMSGSYKKIPDKYARVQFDFVTIDNGIIVDKHSFYYCDMRNFGTLKFTNRIELAKKLKELGPDMLSNPCFFDEWQEICEKKKNKTLVSFLMDQKSIAGVGNIYKSESLYLAHLDPRRLVSSLNEKESMGLYESVIKVLNSAYKLGGSTIRTYSDLYGIEGNYIENKEMYNHAQDEHYQGQVMVYGRTKDMWGNSIEQLKLDDGRTTYYVKEIQR